MDKHQKEVLSLCFEMKNGKNYPFLIFHNGLEEYIVLQHSKDLRVLLLLLELGYLFDYKVWKV